MMMSKVVKARFDDGRDRGGLAAKATIRFACGRSSGILGLHDGRISYSSANIAISTSVSLLLFC